MKKTNEQDDCFLWSVSDEPDAVRSEVVRRFQALLGLTYIESSPVAEINVCYASSAEVRVEYKTSLSLSDLEKYVHGCVRMLSLEKTDQAFKEAMWRIPYPANDKVFWDRVQRGSQTWMNQRNLNKR